MKNDLISKLEAVLFYLAGPVDVVFLAKTLDVTKKEITSTLDELGVLLKEGGIRLVFHDDEVMLVTAPKFSELIEKIVKEERERDLGRAGIETLSIIAYKGPVSKKEIEYIRGVNSQWALRSLLLRGLIEKKGNREDERVVMYTITGDTLRYLGLSHITELSEYHEMRKKLEVKEEEEQKEKDDEEQ